VNVERGYRSDLTITMLVLLVAAGVITLGGTFTAVGLAAVESRPDLATFAAVGAGPALRRRISAGQAGVIAGLGTVLGLASGTLVGWCLILLERPVPLWIAGDRPVDSNLIGDPLFEVIVPVLPLVGVGVGIPLLAVAVGYAATRSRLPVLRRLAQ
jgi:putative ABC transport system permease protein